MIFCKSLGKKKTQSLRKEVGKATYSSLAGEIQPHAQRPQSHLGLQMFGFTIITKQNTSLKLL